MKKILMMVCVSLLFVMLPVMALAITEAEWNQQCKLKVDSPVTIYSTNKSDSTSGILATDTDIDMWECGTLPKGTYVKQNSYDSQLKMWEISYYKNGSIVAVFVREGNKLVSAMTTITIYDGNGYETRTVPEALLDDEKALFNYLANEMPGYTFSMMADGKTILKEKGSASESAGTAWKSLRQRAAEAAAKLNLNLDELQQALVYAPKGGKASLWPQPSAKGKSIDKLYDGTVVYIVEEGSKFTQVLVGDITGYIVNSALETIDAEQLPLGEGVLSYKGKTTGRTKIYLRSHSTKSRKLVNYPMGTQVLVWSLSEDEKWYEIEYEGVRFYLQAEYLTVTEIYTYDEETEEEVPAEDEELEEDDKVYYDDVYYGDDYDFYENIDENLGVNYEE